VGVVLLLAPRGWPVRWIGVFWFIPLLSYIPDRPAVGEFVLTALDVGQGSAMVIRTRRHNLVYDAGPRFNERFDTGKLAVLPYLKFKGVSVLDVLLISHGDNDHSGGSDAIIRALPVQRIISSEPGRFTSQSVEDCRKGQSWVWDRVRFTLLHPDYTVSWDDNNSSCVLLVESGNARVLLTGDIEKRAERHLLKQHDLKPVSVLTAPHHGSGTSSTPEFVSAASPEHVVFNAGLFNRYKFPTDAVRARYRQSGSKIWITGEKGALEYTVDQTGVRNIRSHRQEARRYWHFEATSEP
jgi:competence protein ComEC